MTSTLVPDLVVESPPSPLDDLPRCDYRDALMAADGHVQGDDPDPIRIAQLPEDAVEVGILAVESAGRVTGHPHRTMRRRRAATELLWSYPSNRRCGVVAKPFKGVINVDIKDSVPDWEPYTQPIAPEGASNVLYIVLDRKSVV